MGNKRRNSFNMDSSKYKKKCPRCGAEIEPERYATKGDKAFGDVTAVSGALIGATFGGSIGAGIGAVAGYFAGKATIMSIENDHDMNQGSNSNALIVDVIGEKRFTPMMILMIQVG